MLSVTCTNCNARYTMSEELYLRKGGGQAVIVTCKRCKFAIRFDAAESAKREEAQQALSQEPPADDRKESVEQDAADTPSLESSDEAGPFVALSSGFFGSEAERSNRADADEHPVESIDVRRAQGAPAADKSSPSAPKLLSIAPPKPARERRDVAASSLSDESETSPAAAKHEDHDTLRRLPAPPPRRTEPEHEPEPPSSVEAELAPPSSGAPSLATLTSLSQAPKPPEKKVDDVLASLGVSPKLTLGPPTIDLSGLTEPKRAKLASPTLRDEAPLQDVVLDPFDPIEGRRGASSPTTAPIAKPAEPAESRRSYGVWFGVALLAALATGAVLFKSKQEAPIAAQDQAPPIEPLATAITEPEPPPPVAPEPEASASAAPKAVPVTAHAKPGPEVKRPNTTTASGGEPRLPSGAPEPTPPTPNPTEAATAAEPAVVEHGPFQPDAARAALDEAAVQAASCRTGDDPAGSATVIVTFAPSGRVTSATVNGKPFAGTATGGCIASAMRRAKVPPFDGEKVTVSKTINVQ